MIALNWKPIALVTGLLLIASISAAPVFSHEKSAHGAKSSEAKIEAALAKLPEADQAAARAQRYCATMDHSRLGAMGRPVKVQIDGKPVFLCCEGCKDEAVEDGPATLAKVAALKKITAALAKLSPADLALAEAQGECPVQVKNRLGIMGAPVKIVVNGKPVFLCCNGCKRAALSNPQQTLAKVEEFKKAHGKGAGDGHHDHDHAPATK